jgi:hypothetical protein
MEVPQKCERNIEKGDILGEIQVFDENKQVYSTPLLAKNKVSIKKKWFHN